MVTSRHPKLRTPFCLEKTGSHSFFPLQEIDIVISSCHLRQDTL
ncbi:uncharacterized protein M6B38_185580 [Iris pallida]|uniref:Uncharacterized protein n=1 Tax=Iris pallida TaxID=29817 RepID=A0AAX6EJH2_IRIPA|nr:uncharacterized protein M6B38_185580 [Iris pallida]